MLISVLENNSFPAVTSKSAALHRSGVPVAAVFPLAGMGFLAVSRSKVELPNLYKNHAASDTFVIVLCVKEV